MSRYQLAYNATTFDSLVQEYGAATVAGYTNLGDFYHDGGGSDELGGVAAHNHVMFHHVRDMLYRVLGAQNMQRRTITLKYLTGITVSPSTTTKAVAATQQLTTTFAPTDAANKKITYVSSDASKATVNATGLITAVATGSAVITVTSEDGGFTGTCVVTVS